MISRKFSIPLAFALMFAMAQPAEAAPATVSKVQVVAASTSALKLDWPTVKGAKRYDVFFSTSYAKVKSGGTKRKTGRASSYTVRGLRAGTTYCFMVRAVGSSTGKRSQRTCKPTVRSGGTSSGLKLRVVTFNTCSSVCNPSQTKIRQGRNLLTNAGPDIIALQEAGAFGVPSGYTAAFESNAKYLLYKTSRFTSADAGEIYLGHNNWAVWAELVDKKTQRHLVAVSAHLQNGKSKASASKRRSETGRLIAGANRARHGLPVILAGDFNSNKNRGSLDTVAPVMHKARFWDAYDQARALAGPNWNSSLLNGKPKFGVKWGDHVDHVWVTSSVRVHNWVKLGTLSRPYASDHFPVRVDLTVR